MTLTDEQHTQRWTELGVASRRVLGLFVAVVGCRAPSEPEPPSAADHFDVLAPASELIAEHILEDTGEAATLSIDRAALVDAMAR